MRYGVSLILFVLLLSLVVVIVDRQSTHGDGAAVSHHPEAKAMAHEGPSLMAPETSDGVLVAGRVRQDTLQNAVADSLRQDWIRIPGTVVAIWPKPRG
jgi:hypothetical protein